jgi:hypothetical protein
MVSKKCVVFWHPVILQQNLSTFNSIVRTVLANYVLPAHAAPPELKLAATRMPKTGHGMTILYLKNQRSTIDFQLPTV